MQTVDFFEDATNGYLLGMDREGDEAALRAIFGSNINVDFLLREPDEARLTLPFDNADAGLADTEFEDALGLVYLSPSRIQEIRRGGDKRYWLPRPKRTIRPYATTILPAYGWFGKGDLSDAASFRLYQIEQREERAEDYKATYSVPKLGLNDIHCDTDKQQRLVELLRQGMTLGDIAVKEGVRPEAILRRFNRIVERSRQKKRAVKMFAEHWSHTAIAEEMDLPVSDVIVFVKR